MSGGDSAHETPVRSRGKRRRREGVSEVQRGRILLAMTDACREHGVSKVTVSHVIALAGVSRRTFYEIFDDREDCFVAAFDRAVSRAAHRVVPAYNREEGFRDRTAAGLQALLEFLDEEPSMGALCIVDALAAGPRAAEHRARVLAILTDVLDEGRERARACGDLSHLTAEGIVGAVLAVVHTRMLGSRPGLLIGLHNRLMSMIVLPYLGADAAAQELARPAPRKRKLTVARGDPLQGLETRLTYRTVRVLAALADRPGLSNRQVADDAGVSDPGQISKLLLRLGRLGLATNRAGEGAPGVPNCWHLTQKGADVERAIRAETGDHLPA